MNDPRLAAALERAEGALERIERAAASVAQAAPREVALREKVRAVVAELDEMISAASGR